MRSERRVRERHVVEALHDLAPYVDLGPADGYARPRRLTVIPHPGPARARALRRSRVVAAAAAIAIAAASFAFVWRSFSPTGPGLTPADPTAGWVTVTGPGVSLRVPPGSHAIVRPGAWIDRLRRQGVARPVLRAWRQNPTAFVVLVDLAGSGTLVVWRPRPARDLQAWISARAAAIGAVPARDVARGPATLAGRDAIHLSFDLRGSHVQTGYELVAEGSRWNLSFTARDPDADALDRLDLVLAKMTFAEETS